MTPAAGLSALLAGDPATVREPYRVYAALREHEPVHWSPDFKSWFVTRYEDVVAGLRSDHFSAARMPALLEAMGVDQASRPTILGRSKEQMINSDPPEHGRLRGLFRDSFRVKRIAAMRATIEALAHELLDDVAGRGEMDLVADYAMPLPVIVLADLMGVSRAETHQIQHWANDIAGFLSVGNVTGEELSAYVSSWGAMADFITQMMGPDHGSGDDLLFEMIQRRDAGEASSEELISNLVLLAVAGHETTTNMIGLGTNLLLMDPDARAVAAGESPFPTPAVEEILRYEPTAQWDFRIATSDVLIGDTPIAQGELVNFVLAAANRDPDQFPDPDRFDVTRSPNRHLAFGWGPHLCLGAPLARLEMQIALDVLFQRLPDIRLSAEPVWKQNIRMRGIRTLRVEFTPQ